MTQPKRMAEFVYGDPAEILYPRPLACLIRTIIDVPGIRIVEVNIRLDRSSALKPATGSTAKVFSPKASPQTSLANATPFSEVSVRWFRVGKPSHGLSNVSRLILNSNIVAAFQRSIASSKDVFHLPSAPAMSTLKVVVAEGQLWS